MELSKEYQRIFSNFKKCVDERSLNSMNHNLYEHFYLHAGFIAHYNIDGFRHEYSGFRFLQFVQHFLHPHFSLYLRPIHNDERSKQIAELNKLMQQYLLEQVEQIKYEFENREIRLKVAKLRALADELGYDIVPKNTGEPKLDLNTTIESNGQLSLF
jgi:hypothetical protein